MSEQPTTDDETESPRTTRITFVVLSFAAGCILLPPRQWISAIMMGVLTLALAYRWRADLASWWAEGRDQRKKPAARASVEATAPGPAWVPESAKHEGERAAETAEAAKEEVSAQGRS